VKIEISRTTPGPGDVPKLTEMGVDTPVSLVAGGAGFLGFHLCKRLLRERHRVVCLDDLSTGLKMHVDLLSGEPGFNFVLHDITEPIDLRVDRIFNLACPASPLAYQSDPVKTMLTNVVGTRNMLELARANHARILQASTSEVYGDPLEHPQSESYRGNVATMGPRACYDEGKRSAEALMYDYHRCHGVDTRIARIFNTYGPGMREDDGRVVSNFVLQALRRRDLTVYGDGTNTRSMCYVDDLIDGLCRLMNLDHDPGPVNLGNPQEISVLEFARLVLAITGSSSGIAHRPAAMHDPRVRCPDISRARHALDWEPRVTLEEGLNATIDHFRDKMAEELSETV